ncbi:TetR family transcriptional regulator [Paenibacillus sp. EKM202P]|uniref:TetR/AcrR family transcriptional regulator n=1 Tax=Paenibacillus TaxID=44249 RepID=UPI0013ED609E|nr:MULTISPECIES: TetR family transcriptional regulator [unclassified Paenibacillus]KAF6561203.1 TetR family transcriptional regulator [Paenibacillus sp. EKM202P]KAF6566161.1 TetR family transcriptional regulator [Paenibacillus sp. EKM207P]
MSPRTKEQNEEIRLRRLAQIRKAAADVFLNKGPLLEIRDVAVQAGLGYGTVYHYYSNKGNLLHDLLWDALERAGGWLETPLEAQPKAPPASASEKMPAGGHFGLAAAADTGNSAVADSQSGSRETAAATELGPVAAAGVRLLQLWAEDHALYLLHKLAGEGFASLPEGRSAPLSAAFRREVLTPLAALLETDRAADGTAASGGNAAEPPYRLQRTEMLLAALVGCASLSLRRGKLHEEARDIVRFLKL